MLNNVVHRVLFYIFVKWKFRLNEFRCQKLFSKIEKQKVFLCKLTEITKYPCTEAFWLLKSEIHKISIFPLICLNFECLWKLFLIKIHTKLFRFMKFQSTFIIEAFLKTLVKFVYSQPRKLDTEINTGKRRYKYNTFMNSTKLYSMDKEKNGKFQSTDDWFIKIS